MAKKFLTSLDLNKNQLLNAVIDSKSSAPSSPVAGQIYYNTGNSTLQYYSGGTSSWITLAQGGDLTSAINNAIDALDTDDIEEGANNLYFTNQRAIDAGDGVFEAYGAASTVAGNLSDHISDSSTHGVTGDIVGTSDTQTLSNKTFSSAISFNSGGGVAGSLGEDGSANMRLASTTYDLELHAGNNVVITTNNNDIILNADGAEYIGSATSTNRIATRGHVTDRIGEFIGDNTVDGTSGNTVDARIATAEQNAKDHANTVADTAYNNAVSYADGLTTADIAENSGYLYFTDARARTAISSGNNTISYNSSTGAITANTSTMATVSYVDGEITDLTTYVDQEISDSANTVTAAYIAADSTLSNTLTSAYQSADSALETSLTQDFNDADNTVLSTLRSEISAASQGLDIKASVRAATTANITLSGTQTVDGVSLSADNRVLVKNQSTGSENGIYLVKADAWVRADDAGNGELTPGSFTFVEEGTANGDSGWVISTDGAITVGTTAIAWTQFSGTGQIVAGAGLTKTGNTIDAVGTADRITVNANSIDISSTYVGQSSITTLGTVTTGTWNGSAVDVAHGGTGATTLGDGEYLVGNGTGAIQSVSSIPGSDIDGNISGNAVNVTGTVAIGNGGTGATTAAGARANLSATTKYATNNTTLNPTSNTVTWTVSHNLNTSDVTVQMRDLADGALVEADVAVTNANTVTISWYSTGSVSADAYRVVVVG